MSISGPSRGVTSRPTSPLGKAPTPGISDPNDLASTAKNSSPPSTLTPSESASSRATFFPERSQGELKIEMHTPNKVPDDWDDMSDDDGVANTSEVKTPSTPVGEIDDWDDTADNTIAKKENNVAPTPPSSTPEKPKGVVAFFKKLFGISDLPRLSSGPVRNRMELLLKNAGFSEVATPSSAEKADTTKAKIYTKETNGMFHVVMPSSTDHDPKDKTFSLSGGYSVQSAIKEGLAASGGKRPVHLTTMVAQALPMFRLPFTDLRFGPQRMHWVEVGVTVTNKGVTATMTDSKSKAIGGLYSEEAIKKQVQAGLQETGMGNKAFEFKSEFQGEQSLFNETDCGYHAIQNQLSACGAKAPTFQEINATK